MALSLYPLFGLCIDPPLPGADAQACALALLESPQLAACMEKTPAPILSSDSSFDNSPTATQDLNLNPTLSPRPR